MSLAPLDGDGPGRTEPQKPGKWSPEMSSGSLGGRLAHDASTSEERG